MESFYFRRPVFRIAPVLLLLFACSTTDPSVTLRSGFCSEVTEGARMREQLNDISLKTASDNHCPEAWVRMSERRQNSSLKSGAHKWD